MNWTKDFHYNTSKLGNENLIGKDHWTYDALSVKCYLYVALPLGILGILLNVLSASVLRRDKTMKHTTRFLLQMLAVADSAFLVGGFVFSSNQVVLFADATSSATDGFICHFLASMIKYSQPFFDATMNAAVWMVVIVTAERYVAICWPLYAPRHITMTRVRVAVGVTWFVSFALYVVLFCRFTVSVLVVDGTVCYVATDSEIHWQVATYRTLVRFLTTFLVPLSFLCFCDFRLLIELRRSDSARREQLGAHLGSMNDVTMAKNERRCTRTMIVVVIVFIVCQLPGVINLVFGEFLAYESDKPDIQQIAHYSNLLAMVSLSVNSACNFFIYFLMGKRFRKILSSWIINCRRSIQSCG